ncbi:hypothetical protein [Flavobacterium microcysteis]|nr:hypothetical protein [Flavobacterium microcysteis]
MEPFFFITVEAHHEVVAGKKAGFRPISDELARSPIAVLTVNLIQLFIVH